MSEMGMIRGRVIPNETGLDARAAERVPNVSHRLVHWFTQYSRGYVHRHFHSLRVLRSHLPSEALARDGSGKARSLVIYSNHASWWDPLVCLVAMNHFFTKRTIYAPMDALMLEKYKMFRRLGFFGVEQRSARGALEFVRTAEAIVLSPNTLLVITPQGRFADVRERPVHFEAGIGHLAARLQDCVFIPCALEYVFWEERLPEILLHFGEPIDVSKFERSQQMDHKFQRDQWTSLLEDKLKATQELLAAESLKRIAENFQVVLRGAAGQGGVYDWWRSLQTKMTGKQFRREHGIK